MEVQPRIFALLAAQVALVRDRIESEATVHVGLLCQAADTVARFAALLDRFARHAGALPPELKEALASAAAADAELTQALDELACVQAQKTDLSRQMADGVVRALCRLDAGGAPLSPEQIAAFFVSQEQHAVHAAALRKGSKACDA